MKNNHIMRHLRALSVCAFSLLLAACQQDQEGLPVAQEQAAVPVRIGFTLATTGGQDAAATRVGTDQAGSEWESYIDIAGGDFRFLLFDAGTDTYLTSFTPQSVTPAGQGPRGYEYYVEGELDQPYENFKLVVLANWAGYPQDLEGRTIEDICTSPSSGFAYSDAEPFIPSATKRIPLYGVKTVTATLRPDLATDLGTVDLLRAMCKVEVKCTAPGFTLTGVTLHRYAAAGMCAPTGVYSDTETDWEADEKIHMPASDIVRDNGELSLQQSAGNTYTIYLPEIDNTAETCSYMEVTLLDAEGNPVSLKGDPYIFFRQYDDVTHTPTDGTDFDLIRNHWYSYDITAVDDGQLTFEYQVLEWNRVDSQIGWYPETGDTPLMAAWPSEYSSEEAQPDFTDATKGDREAVFCYLLYPRYANDDHDALEDNSAFAGFYFHLEEPEGAIWEAELTNTEDFRLNENGPYDSDNDSVQDSKCAVRGRARSKPYQIQVRANHAWTEPRYDGDDQYWDNNTAWGNEIEESGRCRNIYTDLRIRISIDGGQTWNYLDINKEDRDIDHSLWGRRRFAGEDNYNIRIWQLKAEQNEQSLFRLVTNLRDDNWGINNFWNPYNVDADDF